MSLTMLCDSPFRRMKQCLAQIERKTGALREAYFDMKKKAFKVQQWEKAGDEYSMIKAEEGRVGMASSQDSIEHAMREINMFQTAYEDIREQYGIPEDWDEADFEESEAENHIRMAFRYLQQFLLKSKLKMTKKTIKISIIVGTSLIILKNFDDLVLELFFKDTRHLPR